MNIRLDHIESDLSVPVALPFMGEFGSKLLKHISGIVGVPRPLIICHEVGEEALYPDATDRVVYERPNEDERKAGCHIKGQSYINYIKEKLGKRKYIEPTAPFKWPHQYFIPEQRFQSSFDFDVLLFPRKKEYAYGRNWQYWEEFYAALSAKGISCMIAGQPDSTAQLEGCPAIWEIAKPEEILDATIWAINKAKFRIGTATGTTFLSLLCGKPVIVIIGDNGMDAQGSKNGFNAGSYFKIDHQRVGWRVIAHWGSPDRVMQEFLEIYGDQTLFEMRCKAWVVNIHTKYGQLAQERRKELRDYIYYISAQTGEIDPETLGPRIGYNAESICRACDELIKEGFKLTKRGGKYYV